MEYYVYLSRRKVDMLYEQLSGEQRHSHRTTARLGIPQVGGIERTTEASGDVTVYQKLKAIVEHLGGQKEISSIGDSIHQETLRYVEDEGEWKSALLGKSYDYSSFNEPPTSYVVYCERPEILVFLVGSPEHVLGHTGQVPHTIISPTWTMDEYILGYVRRNLDMDETKPFQSQFLPGLFGMIGEISHLPVRSLNVLFRVYGRYQPTSEVWDEALEYYTERVMALSSRPKVVLVGSPLFVALA